jgi:large subunit ribosomal protein L4
MAVCDVVNTSADKVGEIEVSDELFGVEVNTGVLHEVVCMQRANRRAGNASTKTRGEVRGGGRKPWRQKGTGRARQGTIRAPQWRGGGIVFGPAPRSYAKRMPRKMRRLALRSALSVKAQEGRIIVLDDLSFAAPRTKDMVVMLDALGVERNALVLLPETNDVVELSARNLPYVKTLRADYINVRDLLGYQVVIMPQKAIDVIADFLGETDQEAVAEEE